MSLVAPALLIPIIAVGGFWAVIILGLVFWHRERMARLQNPTPASGTTMTTASPWAARSEVERGIRLAALGTGLVAGLLPIGFGPWLIIGLIPFILGCYRVAMVSLGLEPEGHPSLPPEVWLRRGIRTAVTGLIVSMVLLWIGVGPWLIAGFIPFFIGLGDVGVAFWWRRPADSA
jgi:hypothetical protein